MSPIETESDLRRTIEWIARMYRLSAREAAEPLWDSDTRTDVVDGTETMIGKLERQVAEYLARKYGLVSEVRDRAA